MSAAPTTLVVLADDLTGAADCAARARHAGHAATVLLRHAPPLPAGMVTLSSETRALPPAAAAARVHDIASELRDAVVAPWYKKIDSTLRGNIGVELVALLDVLDRQCAVVCPAFPAQGRGLHHGFLAAPALDLPALYLPALLAPAGLRVAAIDLEQVRAGADALAALLHQEAAHGARLLVLDALHDDDLAAIAGAAATLPSALCCGSAGLLGAVAAQIAPAASPAGPALPVPAGPALLVVGSASAAAQRQIAALSGSCRICCAGKDEDAGAGGDVLLRLSDAPLDAPLDGPEALALAARLADSAVRLLTQIDASLLVLTGGDTAAAVLGRLHVARLEIERELLPGMPLARAQALGRQRAIVLKAGNHGNDTALADLLRLARG